MNSTSSSDYISENLRIVSVWCFSFILLFGVISNTTIIYIYGFASRQRFNNLQRLLMALALSDFLKTITGPPLYIYWNARGFTKWDYGVPGCKFFPALWQYFTNISLGLLILLILETSRARITAGRGQFNWVQMSRGIAVIIFLSVFRFVPLMHHYEINEKHHCILERTDEFNIANISLTFLTDGIYFIFFIVSLASIKLHFYDRNRKLKRQNVGGSFTHGLDLDHTLETRVNVKIVYVMAAIFVVCILPYDILQLYISFSLIFKRDFNKDYLAELEGGLLIFNMFHCCSGLAVYIYLNPKFRQDMVNYIPLFHWMQRCGNHSDAGNLDRSELPTRRVAGSGRRKGFDDSQNFSLMNNNSTFT